MDSTCMPAPDSATVTQCTTSYSQSKWKRRLPASRFGSIVGAGDRGAEVANSILSPNFSDTEATVWGKEHERDAIQKLEEVLGVTVAAAVKVVPSSHRWLVCVPDGVVSEDNSIVEVKCPYKCQNSSFERLAETDEKFCLKLGESGVLGLDPEHDYYYQVQGMLNMMNIQSCYFAVWSPSQFHYQVINQDKQLWENVIFPKLQEFYREYFLDNQWNTPDISEEEMEEGKTKILEELSLSEEGAEEVEVITRGQAGNQDWRTHRARRLTASNFGRVAKLKASTSRHNTVLSILYPDDISDLPAVKHGRESEVEALAQLGDILNREGQTVTACGLFVDSNSGFLAASPDGVLDSQTLVEVKCPLKCLDASIEELAATDSTFCLHLGPEGRIRLKERHNYYYQIQGQLYCARRKKCIFFLWSPTEYHMETVDYDPEFWLDLQETLSAFYLDCILPEIVDPRAPRGLKIREPKYLSESPEDV